MMENNPNRGVKYLKNLVHLPSKKIKKKIKKNKKTANKIEKIKNSRTQFSKYFTPRPQYP